MDEIINSIEEAGLAWVIGTSPTDGCRYAQVAKTWAKIERGHAQEIGMASAGVFLHTPSELLILALRDYKSRN